MEVLTVGIIGALKLVLTRRFPALVKLVVVVVLALYLMALPGVPGSSLAGHESISPSPARVASPQEGRDLRVGGPQVPD